MWVIWYAGETGRAAAEMIARAMKDAGETVEMLERHGGFEQLREALEGGARVIFLASPAMAGTGVPAEYVHRFTILVVEGDPDTVIPPSLRAAEIISVPDASLTYCYQPPQPTMAAPPPASESPEPDAYLAAAEASAPRVRFTHKKLDRVRKPRVSLAEPEPPTTDFVHFTVTAPSCLRPGSTEEIIFWCHLEAQRDEMLDRAREAHGTKKPAVKSEGPAALERGTLLTVAVDLEGLNVQPRSKKVLWTGDIGNAGFTVAVPSDAAPGSRKGVASIRVEDAEIARLDFVLHVKRARAKVGPAKGTYRTHHTAFASYASKDREQVLARVQGIQKAAPQLDIWLDLVSLQSGGYWNKELEQTIPASDVFYLFWSRNARDSEWVEREWRCALAAKGLDFIDPVPLESPQLAPPPPELAAKHFNDRWLVVSKSG